MQKPNICRRAIGCGFALLRHEDSHLINVGIHAPGSRTDCQELKRFLSTAQNDRISERGCRRAAHLRRDQNPAKERLPVVRCDEAPVAEASRTNASQSGTDRAIRAPIIVPSVTRGMCGRVRPAISSRFATVSKGRF
jgi:hypothetical protein